MITDAKIEDWTAEQYFASDRLSRSDLRDALLSPALFHGRRTGSIPKVSETPSMRFGTAVHLAVFEPEEAARRLVVERKFGTKKAEKEAKAAWKAELPSDAMIFSADDMERIGNAREAVMRHQVARSLLGGRGTEGSIDELTITWNEDGIGFRKRLDKVRIAGSRAFIADLKTSSDPSPSSFERSCVNYGYDLQAAFYPRAVPAVFGVTQTRFAFVVVRSSAPFEVAVYLPDPDFLALGQRKVEAAIEAIKRCRDRGDWSAAWQQAANTLSAPRWALKAEGL